MYDAHQREQMNESLSAVCNWVDRIAAIDTNEKMAIQDIYDAQEAATRVPLWMYEQARAYITHKCADNLDLQKRCERIFRLTFYHEDDLDEDHREYRDYLDQGYPGSSLYLSTL
jgi:hypothetical protein